jgi:hypothetical protein
MVRDILGLRILSLIANIAFIVANLASSAGPNYTFMAWSALFVVLNTTQIGMLIMGRYFTVLSQEDEKLRAAVFPHIEIDEFRRLISLGKRYEMPVDHTIVEEGGTRNDVLLIESGTVSVVRDGKMIDIRRDGDMIGEIAFVAHRRFYAAMRVTQKCRVIAWDHDVLHRLFVRRPALAIGFHAAFIGRLHIGANPKIMTPVTDREN